MFKRTVLLNSFEKVKEFSNEVTKIEGSVDAISGKYVVDAKSIMGLFSLNLSNPICLCFEDTIPLDEVENILGKFFI